MNRTSQTLSAPRGLFTFMTALTLVACASAPPPKDPEKPVTTATPEEEAPKTPEPVATTKSTPEFKAGPGGFPLPSDAVKDDNKSVGPIEVFVVQRGKDAALAELRTLLEAAGWKIDSEEASPSNASMRLKVTKDGVTFKASVTGDDAQAAYIVTVPKK